MEILGQMIAQQAIDLSNGLRINNKVKREQQLILIFTLLKGFLERNPQYN